VLTGVIDEEFRGKGKGEYEPIILLIMMQKTEM